MAKVFFTKHGKKISLDGVSFDLENDFDTDTDVATGDDCSWYVCVDGEQYEVDEETYDALIKHAKYN